MRRRWRLASRIGEILLWVGELHRLCHLDARVVDVVWRDDITKPAELHALLCQQQLFQISDPLTCLADTKSHLNLDVHLGIPGRRVHFHPFPIDLDHAILDRVFHHQFQHLAEQVLHTGLCEDASDHLDPRVGRAHHLRHAGRGLVSEGRGVQALVVHPRSRAHLAHILEEIHQPVDRLVERGGWKGVDHARSSDPNDTTRTACQEIIDLHSPLHNLVTAIVDQIHIVQHLPQQRGADQLEVGNLV